MANKTYTVKKGDTLTSIAKANGTTVANLVALNDITDPDYIVVGQVLTISGTATTAKKSTSSKATIKVFGLQSNTDRTMYATWTWTRDNTEEYQVQWHYATGDGIWFEGSDSTVKIKQCTYSAPSNATKVKFKVKPISKKKKSGDKEVSYWTASWSTEKTYDFKNNPPTKPSAPAVEIDKYKLTARLDNLDLNASHIQFQVVKNDKSTYATSDNIKITTTSVVYSCTVAAGNEYKVRCRAYRDKEYSEWSEYSGNLGTAPSASGGIKTIKALSETSVQIDWENVKNAKQYEIQYTTERTYFDSSNEVQSMTVDATVAGHAEITGLETGDEYFFRVRAVNDNGESSWTEIKSIILGEKPSVPTTWSSTTTVISGEPLTLFWVHNSRDGSSQKWADLELEINGVKTTKLIMNSTDEEEKDKTSSYIVDTTEYNEGVQILWRVRTCGITNEYSDWSIQRTVDIYAPPTLEIEMTDATGTPIDTLTSFPFYISGLAGPNTQKPIGYHLTIIANETYETVDQIGNRKIVKAGDSVYSKYFDISDPLNAELSANNIDLENNIEYKVTCVVAMNSGLTSESSLTFVVAWTDEIYEPNAEIGIDTETVSATIRPYCEDEDGNLIEDITLSVYRREFDGTFVEIGTGIDNVSNTYITDPHPALDYARYRIVAISNSTGAVSYYDVPGIPVDEKGIIIQWDEDWTNFETTNEDALGEPPWAGSLLRLPYNVDISDNSSPDSALIEYVGRAHPVSYYGTQIGETSSWSTDIDKKDKETLYALRRLKRWLGDVYVREASGSGYWANIKVSFSQKHRELTIPVTLEVKRVEGGA